MGEEAHDRGAAGEVDAHVLYVTGPLRERLYHRFRALFSGHGDVEVRLDRRLRDRRGGVWRPAAGERRSDDRRRHDPDWTVPPADES
jgi:hypothetical protein